MVLRDAFVNREWTDILSFARGKERDGMAGHDCIDALRSSTFIQGL